MELLKNVSFLSNMVVVNSSDLVLHSRDNIAVVLDQTSKNSSIPVGHKFATVPINSGQSVIKYGMPIGVASCDIAVGEHVHEHNMKTALGASDFTDWKEPQASSENGPYACFRGFSRTDGRAAIRNEIWIVNTVACVNQTATRLADRANRELCETMENVDGFHAFPHPFGCSQLGDDLFSTQKILAGLINHPHAAAVLVLGLGCENNRMESQLKSVHPDKLEHVIFFNTQDVEDEMESGFAALTKLAKLANQVERHDLDANQLILGMKCGGSDGFSGITANPLLGRVADRHCASGGTVLLTEIPEMFGAESVLLSRCANNQVHGEFCELIDEFKNYFRSHGQPISENPSPGNRDGGITTLEEKSLGCVQKGGCSSLVKEVVGYGEQSTVGLGGLSIINGPGNDGVSTTALTCAGANVILFTTGRGTPLGAPAPTLKISTNSDLAKKKPAWIDFDAGRLVSGNTELDSMADELYQLILNVSSGQQLARNEANGYREIAIWKTGVTL